MDRFERVTDGKIFTGFVDGKHLFGEDFTLIGSMLTMKKLPSEPIEIEVVNALVSWDNTLLLNVFTKVAGLLRTTEGEKHSVTYNYYKRLREEINIRMGEAE